MQSTLDMHNIVLLITNIDFTEIIIYNYTNSTVMNGRYNYMY